MINSTIYEWTVFLDHVIKLVLDNQKIVTEDSHYESVNWLPRFPLLDAAL